MNALASIGWGELFSVSCAVCWALGVVLFRKAGSGLPAFDLNLFKNLLGLVLVLPTALLLEGAHWPAWSLAEWLLVLTSGILGIAVADTWYLRALQLMGASRTGIVATLYSPFVILLSVVFLGERLATWQWLGFVLVMAGILLVTWRRRRSEVESADVRAGVLYGAGAVALMAVGIVMVKQVLEGEDFFWTVEYRLVGGVAGMLLVAAWQRRWRTLRRHLAEPQPWATLVMASLLATYVSMILWLAGYRLAPASVASVLNESASAFIVLFAWLLLGESLGPRKLAGLFLTLAGVLVLLLG